MAAVVSESRAKSTWLTGTVGLVVLAAAFVMMVVAAPRAHALHHPTVTHDQLTSWIWAKPDHRVWVTPANGTPANGAPANGAPASARVPRP